MVWVYSGLVRTLAYLKANGDSFKFQIIKCFGIWVLLYYFLLVVFAVGFMLLHVAESDDDSWLTIYRLETISFSAFTMTLAAVAFVFRPNEHSAIIAQVNEQLDETLTEVERPSKIIELQDRRAV
jgi:hypothetical protein